MYHFVHCGSCVPAATTSHPLATHWSDFLVLQKFAISYCAGAWRRPAVLGILMYHFAHCGSCVPAATTSHPLATHWSDFLVLQKSAISYCAGAWRRPEVLAMLTCLYVSSGLL